VQSILFDSTSIFNTPKKRSGDAASCAMFTMDDFNRKVEEEVQRRMREHQKIKNCSTQQALKEGNSTPLAHHDHGIELDDRQEGEVFILEQNAIAPARSSVMRPLNPSCESLQCHATAPQQNPEHPQREEGSQIEFVHAQTESIRYVRSHEFHETPLVPQAQQRSNKREIPSQVSEKRARERLNKSIQVVVENKRDKLRFRLFEGRNTDDDTRRDPKVQNKVISRAYVAAARKALDRGDQEYALELLQRAVGRNPQNAKLLEL